MAGHRADEKDEAFRRTFESCRCTPAEFDHRAHVRLAYVYLVRHGVDEAVRLMRDGLLAFLNSHKLPVSKYHETLTRAWILAVRHFMETSRPAASFALFIRANPVLLDSKILLTHYSAKTLFSPEARAGFVAPDLEPIPG